MLILASTDLPEAFLDDLLAFLGEVLEGTGNKHSDFSLLPVGAGLVNFSMHSFRLDLHLLFKFLINRYNYRKTNVPVNLIMV